MQDTQLRSQQSAELQELALGLAYKLESGNVETRYTRCSCSNRFTRNIPTGDCMKILII